MMMRDNGTRKNFPPQEKTVLLHQAVATRGKTREKTSKRNFPAFSSLFRKISPLLMEYSGTVITPSPGSSGDRPAQPPPCRKRHVDGISCEGQSSRTEILAGLDAGPRSQSADQLAARLEGTVAARALRHPRVEDALAAALAGAHAGDRVLVFGSFHTVAEALRALHSGR